MLLTYDELNLMTDYLNSNDKIIIQDYVSAEEFNYTNPVLIVIDPILSQFRKYDVIKKNNLDYFRDNFSDSINTLQQIVDIYEQEGYDLKAQYLTQKDVDFARKVLETAKGNNQFKKDEDVEGNTSGTEATETVVVPDGKPVKENTAVADESAIPAEDLLGLGDLSI